MAFYLFITPLCLAPSWCLTYYNIPGNEPKNDSWLFLDCKDAYDGEIMFSQIPKIKPQYSGAIDILCLSYLCVYRLLKDSWTDPDIEKERTKRRRLNNWIFTVVCVMCMMDLIYNCFNLEYAYLNAFLRPVIATLFIRSIRTNLNIIWHTFKDSLMILCTIFVFILLFASLALFLFQGSFAGSQDFNGFGLSYYSFI